MTITVVATPELIRTHINPPSLSDVECIRCQSPLDVHQPDGQLAERLLGTCPDCLAWYLIDATRGVMTLLPDETDLSNA